MGFTGLARWQNAPTTGLDIVRDNIIHNHQGSQIGRWQIQLKACRSMFMNQPTAFPPPERSMCTLTMGENTFVLIEDPGAPSWGDVVTLQNQQNELAARYQTQETSDLSEPEGQSQMPSNETSNNPTQTTQSSVPVQQLRAPPHYSMNLFTVKPPGALEHMLGQLRSRWVPIRQAAQTSRTDGQRTAGHHITVDGLVFRVGQDWCVRVGNVVLAGGAVRGLLVEAEYLPVPVLPTDENGSSELLSSFLSSIVPNVPDARISAMTISDYQWGEILHPKTPASNNSAKAGTDSTHESVLAASHDDYDDGAVDGDDGSDIYDYPGKADSSKVNPKDWTGVERERRSSFLVWAALRSEGLL